MKAFLTEDFLLKTQTAKQLYAKCKNLPIIDYHCHVNPQEIYENKHFKNITELWLSGDHYKWRLMRSNGVEERYITGDASDFERFEKFAEALPKAIGNPMYHWCHLELKNYFGYEGVLCKQTAKEVWDLTQKALERADMGVRDIIIKSNVEFIGTTDDPIDSLIWHEKIANDNTFNCVVAPSFRPDKAFNLDKVGWLEYIAKLEEVCAFKIDGLSALKRALSERIEYFANRGAKASDHGLDHAFFALESEQRVDEILKGALSGEQVSVEQAEAVKTNLLLHCASEYKRRDWVMQIHYNCLRNPNSLAFKTLGPDSGFDCIGPHNGSFAIAKLLDVANASGNLPKTVLYSLDPGDNAFLDTIIGSFQGSEIAGKIQHGSAWWFNDNKQGMRDQLISLANLSILGNFVGMLTDSRSFLSYTRHEYFRRILCDLIGEWVENGEYPSDSEQLTHIVKSICYYNAKKYFNL